MTGIDGATIITQQGEILAVGVIIKIEGGHTGGGRLAATKTLTAYGTAIKVSADGMMEAFVQGPDSTPSASSASRRSRHEMRSPHGSLRVVRRWAGQASHPTRLPQAVACRA